MRGQVGGANGQGQFSAQAARHFKAASLVVQRQAVAGFDFQRGHAFGHQRDGPPARCSEQRVIGGSACGRHGGANAAAGPRNVFIAGTVQAHLELAGTLAAINQVGVAIHQAGRDQRATQVVFCRHALRQCRRQACHLADPFDLCATGQERSCVDQPPRHVAGQRDQPRMAPQNQIGVHDGVAENPNHQPQIAGPTGSAGSSGTKRQVGAPMFQSSVWASTRCVVGGAAC